MEFMIYECWVRVRCHCIPAHLSRNHLIMPMTHDASHELSPAGRLHLWGGRSFITLSEITAELLKQAKTNYLD